ncbi:MAG: site-2 protease family protein [Clostridia bacterium]|nr:site-2 protease family protein [Clostridia bacterium]
MVISTVLSTALRLLGALLVFGLIVVIHEWGHFIVAKLMDVQVNEFAMGMGPKLFGWGKKETRYSVRLFPIGGYCAMEGEDAAGSGEVSTDTVTPTDNPRAFGNKKVWRRVLIVVAGATMNLILGFVLLLGYFGICTRPSDNGNVYYAGTAISYLPETAVSYQSGLRVGDELLTIDGKRVFSVMDIQSILQSSADGEFTMTVRRNGENVELPSVKFERQSLENGGHRLIYDFKVNAIDQTVWSTITQSFKMECSVAVSVWRSLGSLITGEYGLNELSGPIGTVDVIGDVVEDAVKQEHWQDGLASVLMLTVVLTVNVGIFNLLPFPALDGGRLLFLIWEGITRKPVPPKYEGIVHAVGMGLLFLLIIVVTFSDIKKLFV